MTDSPSKKERTMNVRNRRLKRASGFFSSARASSLKPAAEGLRWKDFSCSRREGEKSSKICVRASQQAEENIFVSDGCELTRFAHSGLELNIFLKVIIVTSIRLSV